MSFVSLRSSMFLSAPVSLRKHWGPRQNNRGETAGTCGNGAFLTISWARWVGLFSFGNKRFRPQRCTLGIWSTLVSITKLMTENDDGRKHWRIDKIYEREQGQLWNFYARREKILRSRLSVKTHKVWLRYRRLLSVWMWNSLKKSTSVRRNP